MFKALCKTAAVSAHRNGSLLLGTALATSLLPDELLVVIGIMTHKASYKTIY